MSLLTWTYPLKECKKCALCDNVAQHICGKCRAAYYCGKECQREDYNQHKLLCKEVKSEREVMEREERKLRSQRFMPENVFETSVGYFWSIHETRSYMRSKNQYAISLVCMNTLLSVKLALAEYFDMLRLCRGDNMGVRSCIPCLLLQLPNSQQQCYDFIKWWLICADVDIDSPYLNLSGANMCEPIPRELDRYCEIDYLVAIMIIKWDHYRELVQWNNRFYTLLLCLSHSPSMISPDHDVVRHTIRSYCYGPLLTPTIMAHLRKETSTTLTTELLSQVDLLYTLGEARNPRLWKALVNPEPLRALPIPQYVGYKTAEEIRCVEERFHDLLRTQPNHELLHYLRERIGSDISYDTTYMRI